MQNIHYAQLGINIRCLLPFVAVFVRKFVILIFIRSYYFCKQKSRKNCNAWCISGHYCSHWAWWKRNQGAKGLSRKFFWNQGYWEFKYFLGIKVVLSKKWIVILKHKYSLDSLDRKVKWQTSRYSYLTKSQLTFLKWWTTLWSKSILEVWGGG